MSAPVRLSSCRFLMLLACNQPIDPINFLKFGEDAFRRSDEAVVDGVARFLMSEIEVLSPVTFSACFADARQRSAMSAEHHMTARMHAVLVEITECPANPASTWHAANASIVPAAYTESCADMTLAVVC